MWISVAELCLMVDRQLGGELDEHQVLKIGNDDVFMKQLLRLCVTYLYGALENTWTVPICRSTYHDGTKIRGAWRRGDDGGYSRFQRGGVAIRRP